MRERPRHMRHCDDDVVSIMSVMVTLPVPPHTTHPMVPAHDVFKEQADKLHEQKGK